MQVPSGCSPGSHFLYISHWFGCCSEAFPFWGTIHEESMTLGGVGPSASADALCWNFSILAGGT